MKLFKAMKRPVTLAIAAMMAISLIPASPVSAKTEYETKSEDGKEYIIFGSYEQDGDESNGKEPIEWEILDENEKGILVVSRYILDCQPYNKKWKEVTWKTCTLRKWLNKDFFQTAFDSEEQNKINTVKVKNSDNPFWGTTEGGKGGKDTKDKVFCLSFDEVIQFTVFDSFRDDYFTGYCQKLITIPTQYAKNQGVDLPYVSEDLYEYKYAKYGYTRDIIGYKGSSWWLRSPGITNKEACVVGSIGDIDAYSGFNYVNMPFVSDGVRPAMYLKN